MPVTYLHAPREHLVNLVVDTGHVSQVAYIS